MEEFGRMDRVVLLTGSNEAKYTNGRRSDQEDHVLRETGILGDPLGSVVARTSNIASPGLDPRSGCSVPDTLLRWSVECLQ